ncbi:MAG: signal recognition particle-docking protein FtsY [Candidatus Bathyarchaeota archaeon]|jgi:fused signal recognition particle receptor|nr:signal recognition particle-docking protein FtsY [Candidatus Bathyarchaeota archaeon]
MFEKLRGAVGSVIDKLSKTELTPQNLEPLLWDLKIRLIENDVALSVADELCDELEKTLTGAEIGRFEDKKNRVSTVFRKALQEVMQTPQNLDLFDLIAQKRRERTPLILVFVGVNGTGKTTTIAKLAHHFIKRGYSVVLAGSDTYRAGSIEQLEGHGKNLGIRVIKHAYGSDAAAVAFDAIQYAKNRGINTVLVDTAGRMQTNRNLVDEMKKIVAVAKPHGIILVVDALTGNDAVEQSRIFNEAIGIDGVILTKLDADVKGGAAISIAHATQKPIILVGTGQNYSDLTTFQPNLLIDAILASS